MNFNLFQQLLDDPMYKKHTKDLDEEQKKILEEYMKDFMEKMEESVLAPFGVLAKNKEATREFQKLWKSRGGSKETLGSQLGKKK